MTIPAVRRGNCIVSVAQAVHCTESLTRLIACSVTDDVLERLSAAVNPDRVDSELALLNAFASHGDVDMEVSPTLGAILLHAQQAARLSGGLVDPVVGIDAAPAPSTAVLMAGEHYAFDADQHRIHVRRGTVLDLWDIGCAWAAEEIVAKVIMEDPAATLAVVVGPAIVCVGAAWEISEALGQDLSALDLPLRCGLRSFAILRHDPGAHGQGPGAESVDAAPPSPWWDRATVGAEDAVQAVTLTLMAERLGDEAFEHIRQAGGQAEFVGPRGSTALRRRLRTPGWVPKAS